MRRPDPASPRGRAERGVGVLTSEMPGDAEGAGPLASSPSANCQDWRLLSWTVSGSAELLETETIIPTSMRQLMIVEPP